MQFDFGLCLRGKINDQMDREQCFDVSTNSVQLWCARALVCTQLHKTIKETKNSLRRNINK